jgi:hypothetical protein
MPLGSTWWSGGGALARWTPSLVGNDGKVWTPPAEGDWKSDYTRLSLGHFPRVMQAPYTGNDNNSDPGFDTGHFYALLAGPKLLTARITATPGATSVTITGLTWSKPGTVALRAVVASTGALLSATTVPTDLTPATSWASPVVLSGLTVGITYRLFYLVNATPDISGWTEALKDSLIEWRQPASTDDYVDLTLNAATKIFPYQITAQGQPTAGGDLQRFNRPQYITQTPPCYYGKLEPRGDPQFPSMAAYYYTPWIYSNPFIDSEIWPDVASNVVKGTTTTVQNHLHGITLASAKHVRITAASGTGWSACVGQTYSVTAVGSTTSFTFALNSSGYGSCTGLSWYVMERDVPFLRSVCFWWPRRGNDGLWHLRHYQPWAWSGSPAEVIASIAMQAGLSSDLIDQTLFDAAHDAYSLDAPWTTTGHGEPTVYCSRKVGETVYSLIEEVARHSRDLLCITMSGKLALVSRTRPPTLAGLTMSDGVIDAEMSYSTDYILNSTHAMVGQAVKVVGDDTNAPDYVDHWNVEATEEEQLQSYTGDDWQYELSDATSILQYGRRELPGRKVQMIVNGQTKSFTRAQFRFWLDDAFMVPLLGYYQAKDIAPRREISVRQTLVGLDYDIGTRVTGIVITGDGESVSGFCLSKSIDFDRLTVDSVIVEE